MKSGVKSVIVTGSLLAAIVALPIDLAGAEDPPAVPHHDLEVRLWPNTHELEGLDRITFTTVEKGPVTFRLGGFFIVTKTEVDGRAVKAATVERIRGDADTTAAPGRFSDAGKTVGGEKKNDIEYKISSVGPGRHVLSVTYRGVVYDTLRVPEGSRSRIPEETTGLVGNEGVFLSDDTGWYPETRDAYATFAMRVTTPPGIETVTEGKKLSVVKTEKKTVSDWEILYPTRGVVLVAGEYLVREKEIEGITLMAYFFPSEEDLIDSYLEASGRYIRLYNRLIGPYPFSKFAVVENFFPTGFGMPSYTLLGRRVVRLPFIIDTSLDHEVAHNWWGNCVYPDYDKGNWCEGLTTYYADYRYEEEKGRAQAVKYRRDINIDYAKYINESNDLALVDFRSRTDDATRIIGYGKCMMVFHMLKNHIGDDKFYRAMRKFFQQYRFKEASWKDIESVFEEVTDVPMDDFFDRWVRRPGAPLLSLTNVTLRDPAGGAGGYELEVTIRNDGGFALPEVPVVIYGPAKTDLLRVSIMGDSTTFDWSLDERPQRLEVDPDHELFRRLQPAEIPVTIRNVLADTVVIVTPSRGAAGQRAAYAKLAGRLAASGRASVRPDSAMGENELKVVSVIALGGVNENSVYRYLIPPESVSLEAGRFVIDGVVYADSAHAAFAAYASRLDSTRTVCAIVGNSPEAIAKAGHKIVYYGKYGYVTFFNGDRQADGDFPVTGSPLIHRFDD
jgi:aminopeptidase N